MKKLDEQHYNAFRTDAVFAAPQEQTVIEVSGADRASFLHNLCTNNIKELTPGGGCEAFFTSVQGKALLHAIILCGKESTTISASPGFEDTIVPHLEKYHIREDVVITDHSSDVRDIWMAGPAAAEKLTGLAAKVPTEILAHETGLAFGVEVTLVRVPFANDLCFVIRASTRDVVDITRGLASAGITEVGAEVVETARVEAAFPRYGVDINPDSLPQEVGRDDHAISFTKGCYLGQETVARIDALGHVNRQLKQLEFVGAEDVPPPNTELRSENKKIGTVTSACWSPEKCYPVALGYVRREVVEAGRQLESDFGPVRIVRQSH